MPRVMIVQPPAFAPRSGPAVKDATADFVQTNDGKLALPIVWQGIIFSSKGVFIIADDTVRARLATDEEVSYCAKHGAAQIARDGAPGGGILVRTLAGFAGELSQSVKGQAGIAIDYRNPKGAPGSLMLIATEEDISKICSAIPESKLAALPG